MHAALSRVVKSHMDSTVSQMEQVCQRNMAAAQTEMLTTMEQFFDPAFKRLDGHDSDIQKLRHEQNIMAQENERLKKSVDEIKASLAIAERQLSAADLARLAEYDRDADPWPRGMPTDSCATAVTNGVANGPAWSS